MATHATVSKDLSVILEKLKVHAEFAQRSEEELRKLADELTNFDEVFCQFSHLLGPVVDRAIDGALADHRAVFTHSQEEEMAHYRAKRDLACVIHLPIQLFLSRLKHPIPYSVANKISNFFLEYGALHAGLVVGNIRIEWGQEGIVDAQPEDIIPEDEFIGSVHPNQGRLAQVAVEINRQFSLADHEQRIDDKIKLIISTAEEKEEILSNLVRVITTYNLEKKYDIFTCNCQHFVRDALAALGIKETPRFSGQLNAHLQRLKQGKIEIPENFKNHDTLDAYVERQLQAAPGALNQHDMEYLLLHYYRLHMTSMPMDANDDWQCEVPSCKYEHLADRVNREALLSIQMPPRQAIQHYAPSTPTIEELPSACSPANNAMVTGNGVLNGTVLVEEQKREKERRESPRQGSIQIEEVREEDERRESPREERRSSDEELRQQQIAEDELTAKELAGGDDGGKRQKQIYEQHMEGGFHAKVMRKLRSMPLYTQTSEKELDDLLTSLTEFEAFRERFDCFPVTIEETSKGYTLDAAADKEWIEAERLPHDAARSKVKERYESICKLPVRLVLRVKPTEQPAQGSVFDARLDAALLIWDHIFEWNSSGLVIPERVDFKTLPPVMVTSILHGSKWSAYVTNQRSSMKRAAKSRPDAVHKKEVNLLFKLTTKKDDVMSAIIRTVLKYNRYKEYHETNCNNDRFIRDVTNAMGIKNLPEIGGSLGDMLEQSKRLCRYTLPRTEIFVDHAAMDNFVREINDLSLLSIRDVEYLIGKYFQFHLRNWELSHHPDQWACPEGKNCQLKHLEKQLERLSLSSDRKCSIM